MPDIIKLIDALVCSASVGAKCRPGCPYRTEDEVDPAEYKPDFERDGKHYWIGCDCDKIALDAAHALEESYSRDELSRRVRNAYEDGYADGARDAGGSGHD